MPARGKLRTLLLEEIFLRFLIFSDGGSPLSCQIGANWYVVGLVAWGIGKHIIGVSFIIMKKNFSN